MQIICAEWGTIHSLARISTDDQSAGAQVTALTAAGAEKVFREMASGAKTDRAQLRRALDALGTGDVLMVTRLDRLARSTRDLLNTLAAITGKQVGFRGPVAKFFRARFVEDTRSAEPG